MKDLGATQQLEVRRGEMEVSNKTTVKLQPHLLPPAPGSESCAQIVCHLETWKSAKTHHKAAGQGVGKAIRHSTVVWASEKGKLPSDGGGNQQRPLEEVGATDGPVKDRMKFLPAWKRWGAGRGQRSKARRLELRNLSGAHQGLLCPGQGMAVRLLGWVGTLWGGLDCY